MDKNELAVELAKLSLWLESYAEGLPLTFLDHRLVCGDSLTGPSVKQLLTHPISGESLEDLFAKDLENNLIKTMQHALISVIDLEASIGKDVADLEQKNVAKAKLDKALNPFKLLAKVWSRAVMIGDIFYDDIYVDIAKSIAVGEDPYQLIEENSSFNELLRSEAEGVCYELVFPEVFYRHNSKQKGGFHAVLGNPPWDRMLPAEKEFFGGFDLRVLSAPNKSTRERIQNDLLQKSEVDVAYSRYIEFFRGMERIVERSYDWQVAIVNGKCTIGKQDLAALFLEVSVNLTVEGGYVGLVLPAAIHLNEGTTASRKMLLSITSLQWILSFQNKQKIFDIVTNVKFDLLVAKRFFEGTESFLTRFYLTKIDSIYDPKEVFLKYSSDFVKKTSPDYLTFLELSNERDLAVLKKCTEQGFTFGHELKRLKLSVGREFNMTDDAPRFVESNKILFDADARTPPYLQQLWKDHYLVVAEDDSIHQYTDQWTNGPENLTTLDAIQGKKSWISSTKYFRPMFRRIATVVDSRSMMVCMVPPGWISASPQAFRNPEKVSYSTLLALCGVLNSYTFDWSLRLRITATVNLFLVKSCPYPTIDSYSRKFLSRSVLRLSCNHSGYKSLWNDQLGEGWNEKSPKFTWPVIPDNATRRKVIANIDCVVAHLFKLSRNEYEHILSSFTHKHFPDAMQACLASYDELENIGLSAFTNKHEPYWDIPLNDELPKPAIDQMKGSWESSAYLHSFGTSCINFGTPLVRVAISATETGNVVMLACQESDVQCWP